MSRKQGARPHGQIRQSQLVTTFGPGAPLDLPEYSVLVSGLDFWSGVEQEVHEPRLVEKLKRLLDAPSLKLYLPPRDSEDPAAPRTGVTVWQFPEWFITQDVEEDRKQGRFMRSRLLVPRKALTKGKFIDLDRKTRHVVPIRFVRACRRGHIGDIDWYGFIHKDPVTKCRRQLWIDERGTSGDLADVFARCACGERRSLGEAAVLSNQALGSCDGSRPWLGRFTKEKCGEPNRLLVRSASNAYFSQKMEVISLPGRDEALQKAVSQVWENFLEYVDTLEQLQDERARKPPVKGALKGFSDEDVFAEIQARKGLGGAAPTKSVKKAEFETLTASDDEIGNDQPDGDFYARARPRAEWDVPLMDAVERVVLVHRLRQVTAQVGFTRFESAAPDVEGELELGVQRAALSRELEWLPAVENRGEGVFLSFRTEAIERWLDTEGAKRRGSELTAGFDCWKEDHKASKREFFGLPYILLHSLSHLLITAVSLECGYPASSIRERIYAGSYGYGILLFTGSPDAEGTLGGLVQVGRKIHRYLWNALELGRLCSNDPVCAQHNPADENERRFLHGAACHGCVLIAETCCEQHNDFLDRSLVIPTVDSSDAAFFKLNEA